MLVASTFDDVVLVSLLLTLNSPLHCADFSVIDFEQVNAGWESPIVYAITLSKKILSENHNNEICQYCYLLQSNHAKTRLNRSNNQ